MVARALWFVRSALALLALGRPFAASRAQTATQPDGVIIRGLVTSEFGVPLDGNVLIADLNISVRTAPNGRYSIAIPPARVSGQSVTLLGRAIGYTPESRRILVAPGTYTYDFVLRKDINRLDEVVVTGAVVATAQKKLAFSVTKIDTTDLPVASVNALQGLQGKIPGALVFQPSGRPGASPAIVLRGPKSINSAGRPQEPLIIVDGAIINGGTQDINPDDIASFEVIKGAAASTLYGSRAGAGVIQITTKSARGAVGSHSSARSEYGFNDVQGTYRYSTRHTMVMDENNQRFCVKMPPLPVCSRTVDFEEEAKRINDVFSPWALLPYAFERDFGISFVAGQTNPELKGVFQVNPWPRYYDPIAQVITPGAFLNSAVDISSRAGGTGYFASLSNLAQDGAARFLKGYRRSSVRVNVDQNLQDDWSLALNTTYARARQYAANGQSAFTVGSDFEESFFALTRVPPGVDLLRRDQLGRLYIRSNPAGQGLQNLNPLYGFENTIGRLDDDRFLGSLASHYAPTTSVTFDATASADRRRTSSLGYMDRDHRTTDVFGQSFGGTHGAIDERASADLSHNLMFSGRAAWSRGSDLHGAFLARYSYERQDRQSSWAHGEGLSYPRLVTINNATTNITSQSDRSAASAIGVIGGMQLEYKERYIFDGLARYDGSSLFGVDERWHPYYRGSLAWRPSDEPWWPARGAVNDFKLRASAGTAGGRPNFSAQYETFALSSGLVTASTLGNKDLKPEHTLETEYGFDAELFHALGMTLTYARDITRDQLLAVPAPSASGHTKQWQNAGTLDGRTWEFSLRMPIVTRRTVTWTAQLGWDRQRTYITEMNTLPFYQDFFGPSAAGTALAYLFYIAPGVRYGTMYGRKFATSCTDLPQPFDTQCGPGKAWQRNDEGYVVWVGDGNSWRDGVTRNLWQAVLPGCVKDGAALATTNEVECRKRGGTVNAPWGVQNTHWGMATVLRDSTATNLFVPLGNTMPDYRVTLSQNLQWRRLALYALVDMARGNRIFNSERRWSLGDFMAREEDQDGKTAETAKPIGYYWRGNGNGGVGGFYADNRASNRTVEDGSYTKVREVRVSYDLRRLPLLTGQWTLALVGRNLYTWTRYTGWDPEAGTASNGPDGSPNSAAITTGGFFQYPPTRTFTVALSARF